MICELFGFCALKRPKAATRVAILSFLISIFIFSSGAFVTAQDTEQTYTWDFQISNRIILIGQTVWCNVTGFPDTSFAVEFINLDDVNITQQKYGRTDGNGTGSLSFDSRETAKEGNYQVSLIINRSTVRSILITVNYDEIEFIKLENARQDREDEDIWSAIFNLGHEDSANRAWEEKKFKVELFMWVPCFSLVLLITYKSLPGWLDEWAKHRSRTGRGSILHRWHQRVTDQTLDYGGKELNGPTDQPRFDKAHEQELKGLTTEEAMDKISENLKKKSAVDETVEIPPEVDFKTTIKEAKEKIIGKGDK